MSMVVFDEPPPPADLSANTQIPEAIHRLYRKGATFHVTQLLAKLTPRRSPGP